MLRAIRQLAQDIPITRILQIKESLPSGIIKRIMLFEWDNSTVFRTYLEHKQTNPRRSL
jgi:hypothetical protein